MRSLRACGDGGVVHTNNLVHSNGCSIPLPLHTRPSLFRWFLFRFSKLLLFLTALTSLWWLVNQSAFV
jgi:hypothetical protein